MRDWDKELEALMEMTLELLATLDSDSEWTAEEEDKLKRLTKLAGLIDKVKKIIGTGWAADVDSAEDAKIIESFLARANIKTTE